MADHKKLNKKELEAVTGGTIIEELAHGMNWSFEYDPGDIVIVAGYGNSECVVLNRIIAVSGPKYRVKPVSERHGEMVVGEDELNLVAKGGGADLIGPRVSIL
ncbi:MAG: bacteriocin [Lachnospiraceae bacterium]|nr:bacteriocin [Lachnospiraceae bacterium]